MFLPFPRAALDRSIPERFAEQVAHHADRPALRDRTGELSYRELGAVVERIAQAILERLGPASEPVAILLDHTASFAPAVLGALAAGKFYVPLDPTHPIARTRAILEETDAALVLTDAEHRAQAVALTGEHARVIDIAQTRSASAPALPLPAVAPDAPAYIYFTSGSTGRPKGVVDSHRNVMHNVMRYTNSLRIDAEDRLSLLHSAGNSGSVSDIFGALLVGAALLAFDPRRRDLAELAAWIEHERLTVFHAAPAIFRHAAMAAPSLPSLRLVRLEGDQASPQDLEIFKARCAGTCVLVNGLGLTECGLVRQYFVDQTTPIRALVPVGHAVEDMRIALLDANGVPVAAGETGEIVVESRYLALGYWRQPDLTAARFSEVRGHPGLRHYRTGDLGRFDADGCLDYLGRSDFQPKVRGHRIDAAEIEAALLASPAVREASVMVRDDGQGEPRLVAYCVASGEQAPATDALRRHVAERLPRELLPSAFVWLERMPLSDGGKLDRKALPPPGRARPALEVAFVAPRTAVETTLARLMAQVLALDEVGVDDSFFDLGGDSLQGTRLMALIREHLHVELGMHPLFEHPTAAGLAAAIAAAGAMPDRRAPRRAIPCRDPRLRCPLSSAQEGLLFGSRLDPDRPRFNVARALRLRGTLDEAALAEALSGLVERHDALRMGIATDADGAALRFAPALRVDVPLIDLSGLPIAEREVQLQSLLLEAARHGFDLDRPPLWHARLFRLEEGEHVLLLVLHHIVTDGWSEAVLIGELWARYDAAVGGRPFAVSALPIGFGDYAAWQHAGADGASRAAALDYWTRKLDGAPPFLDIGLERTSTATSRPAGARRSIDLAEPLVAAIGRLAQRTRSTPYMVMLATFTALIHRCSGAEDIVVGTAIAGRDAPETQQLVGCCFGMLALRNDVSGDPTFLELVARVRGNVLEAFAHQALPFETLVAALRPERRAGHTPVFQVAFVLEPEVPALLSSKLAVEPLDIDIGESAFELAIFVERRGAGLRAFAEFRTDRFEGPVIERLLRHWHVLLEGAVAAPEQRLSALPLLTPVERRILLEDWNDTAIARPMHRCIHEQIAAQAARAPDAVALEFGARRVTYGELDARADRLALRLRSEGVGPDMPVGLCLERSPELIVGILAILKAGGAFVPLDPDYPAARLAFMLEDTRAPLLLTQRRLLARLPQHAARTLCIDGDEADVAPPADGQLLRAANVADLAYVIYTSGSTGRPKGVMIEHRALANYVAWMSSAFAFDARDSVLQKAPVSFDAAMWEIFVPLGVGARLVLAPPDAPRDPDRIVRLLREHAVTTVQFVPAQFRHVVDQPGFADCPALTRVFCGGEALPGDTVRKFFERSHARLFNLYGPTETCIYSLSWECGHDDTGTHVPIGRPIANTRAYVLDEKWQPVPVGLAGELHIGGDGLARGYWNRPELTQASFVPDPHDARPEARMYRTGDRARLRADGVVEFLGRVDRQAKLRGHRIEPGEIEAALLAHAGLREALVVLRVGDEDQSDLVAYVVAKDPALTVAALHEWLTQRLPRFMLPAAIVMLDELPRTPSGKFDRGKLPEPRTSAPATAAEREERYTAIEVQLLNLWRTLLTRDGIGADDDFFALGGHSLLALQMVDHVNRLYGRSLPLDVVWQDGRTIAGLAGVLRGQTRNGEAIWARAMPIKSTGARPPLFCTPAIGGHLYYYEALARVLDREQPVYGLPAQGADGTAPAHISVEAMAAHAIGLMRAVQPTGPYRLLGFCSAGAIAFEMARQLERVGESVTRLVLADSPAPGTYFSLWSELVPAALRGRELRLLQERLYHLALHPLGLERLRGFRKPGEAHRWAVMSYKPGSFNGRALLIRSRDGLALRDPAGGWQRFLNGGVDVRRLACQHEEMFAARTVELLAAELAEL